MNVETLNIFLLTGTAVLAVAVLAVRLSVRFGLPSLVLYMLIGVALGESGIGIEFDDAQLAQVLAFAALVIILAEGGLTTKWSDLRPSLGIGLTLATVGVAVTTTVIALLAHFVLHMDWRLAVLLGAIFAPTDAAAVFSTLRRLPLKRRVANSLEAESGLNDAPTVVLVTLVSAGDIANRGFAIVAADIGYQLLVGVLVGLVIGRGGVIVLRKAALPSAGLYPLVTVTLGVLAYAAAATIHASGFAAVYVAAVVLGNSHLPHRTATRSFAEGLAWVAQIGLFVMLGLLASPSQLPDALAAAAVAGLGLLVLARPLAVLTSCLPFRVPWRDMAFLSWAGLLGAVPVVLATIALAEGVERADQLFAVVFVVSIVLTTLQAPTLPVVAKWLGIARTDIPRDAEVESAPMERINADLVQVRVPNGSKLHGVDIDELRLPPEVTIALIVRDGTTMVPTSRTVLRHGDEILIVTPRALRVPTEDRLRAVGRAGRLAGWFGETGRDSD